MQLPTPATQLPSAPMNLPTPARQMTWRTACVSSWLFSCG